MLVGTCCLAKASMVGVSLSAPLYVQSITDIPGCKVVISCKSSNSLKQFYRKQLPENLVSGATSYFLLFLGRYVHWV